MMRAMRVDKTTLAALVATLLLYRDPAQALERIPLLKLLSTSVENLENRAQRLAPQLAECESIETAEAVPAHSQLGGGSVPEQDIPTWCLAVTPKIPVDQLAHQLRCGSPSVFGRIHKDQLLLDLRTVFPRQDQQLVEAFGSVAS